MQIVLRLSNMEQILIVEKKDFDELTFKIDTLFKLMTEKKDDDKWMTIQDAMVYTGFKYTWFYNRRVELKAFRDGNGLRYKKSSIDKYMESKTSGL